MFNPMLKLSSVWLIETNLCIMLLIAENLFWYGCREMLWMGISVWDGRENNE